MHVPSRTTFARPWRALAAPGDVLGLVFASGKDGVLRPRQPRRSLRHGLAEGRATRHGCGLLLVFLLMAAPSAASAATGPLLSLTPERVANGHLALAG
jgi:hypothetical protein